MGYDLSGNKVNDFELLPSGRYVTACEDAVVKETKAGTGEYIELKLTVLSPKPFEGRKLWTRFNVVNPSEKAQQIGRDQLKTFMTMGKVKNPNKLENVTDLIGLKTVSVVQKLEDAYGEKNEVKRFEEIKASGQPSLDMMPGSTGESVAPSDIPF